MASCFMGGAAFFFVVVAADGGLIVDDVGVRVVVRVGVATTFAMIGTACTCIVKCKSHPELHSTLPPNGYFGFNESEFILFQYVTFI